jgi:hypothetical protein
MAIKTIPKNNDGGWYYDTPAKTAALGLRPGDIVEMTGDYSYIQMVGLVNDPLNPIIFRPKGIVRVGIKNQSYSWIISESRGFKILADYNGADKFIIGGLEGTYPSQTLTFSGSYDLEIAGVELNWAQVGFHSNKKGTVDFLYKNIIIRDSYIHDLDNPGEEHRAEGLYVGNTDKAYYQKGQALDNVIIQRLKIRNITGDGIQLAKTTNFQILDCDIDGYGLGGLRDQNSGIIVGGCSTGVVRNNKIKGGAGSGSGIQVFGAGRVDLHSNALENVATHDFDDGIYIEGKCSDGPLLQVSLKDNILKGDVGRDIRRVVAPSTIVEEIGNSWNPPVIPPVTPPAKKLMYTVTTKVFDSGVPETTTVTVK